MKTPLIPFFSSKEGTLWTHIYLGGTFKLDLFLHFCLRVHVFIEHAHGALYV